MTIKMPQKYYKEMLSLNIVVTKDMFLIQIYVNVVNYYMYLTTAQMNRLVFKNQWIYH